MDRYEVQQGIKDWLIALQNEALWWDEASPAEVLETVIEDFEAARDLGKFPWETDSFLKGK